MYKHMSNCPDNQAVHNAIARGMGDFSKESLPMEFKPICMVDLDWEENSSDTNERKMASVINGEDWDREAHTGHLFNDEELRQING